MAKIKDAIQEELEAYEKSNGGSNDSAFNTEQNQINGVSLFPAEQVLWDGLSCGQGVVQMGNTSGSVSTMPVKMFGIIWLAFSIIWTLLAFSGGGIMFAAFGIPFIIIGVMLLIGKMPNSTKTQGYASQQAIRNSLDQHYIITNQRVIVIKGGSQLQEEFLRNLRDIQLLKDSRGNKGTIVFYSDNNTTENMTAFREGGSFNSILNAEYVYSILTNAANSAKN